MASRKWKAARRGTATLTDGTIVHFDPDNASENGRYQGGTMDEAEARRLEAEGYIKLGSAADDDDAGGVVTTVLPDNSAAEERLADVTDADDEVDGATVLHTAATVAFPNNPLNAAPGTADTGIDADDPDAPPARRASPRRAGGTRARGKTAKATGRNINTRQAPPANTEAGTNNEGGNAAPTGDEGQGSS